MPEEPKLSEPLMHTSSTVNNRVAGHLAQPPFQRNPFADAIRHVHYSAPEAKPALHPENIPAELTAIPRWVMWKPEERNGKTTKPPYHLGLFTYSHGIDSSPKSS
jgi:hypothetical protein